MRGAIIHAPGDVRFETRDDPVIEQPTDAIITMSATCVCGSDLWERLTIALGNPTAMPMDVDTGQMGKPQLQFNGAPVFLYTVPVRKRLAPGEGYTFQCTAQLPHQGRRTVGVHRWPDHHQRSSGVRFRPRGKGERCRRGGQRVMVSLV
ncbi:MAG: hypothetical protein ACRDQU_01665 [Pseudonocardiaceae bacterium]